MDKEVKNCTKCFNVSDKDECDICSSKLRKRDKICVVEEPLDVVAFENSGIYDGLYFVLGGVISPAEGIGEEEIRFKELKARVDELLRDADTIEVIIATNPSLEGEATASYVIDLFKDEFKNNRVKITRLAMGLPTGADLEYADRLTLKRALEGRRGI
jgi:recombination protein RecR